MQEQTLFVFLSGAKTAAGKLAEDTYENAQGEDAGQRQ